MQTDLQNANECYYTLLVEANQGAENEQKARKADIKYMKEFFPDTVFLENEADKINVKILGSDMFRFAVKKNR